MDLLPNPVDCGLPDKFSAGWRKGQAEAVVRALDSPKRFVVLGMPTGFGKSLVYMATGTLDDPMVVLTSTKGLQSQLITDFASHGLVDIRGMSNYICREAEHGQLFTTPGRATSCDEGACLSGWQCHLSSSGCDYFDAQRWAKSSHCVVTNYAYWMAVNGRAQGTRAESGPPLGPRGRLVLDEAHAAVDELGDHLAVELGNWEIEGVLGTNWPSDTTLEEWRTWARTLSIAAYSLIDEISRDVRRGTGINGRNLGRLRELRNLERKLNTIANGKGQWVHEASRDRRGRRVVRFDPVWPGEYAESALFVSTPKVVLTSATIRPKTLELLGIQEQDYEFIEYPSAFDIRRRPFIWCPTVRVRYDMDSGSARMWVAKIDNIIRSRQDRKGIIHTVSYARRDYLLRYSEFSNRFVVHDSGKIQDCVAEFKRMPAKCGAVLVSPSLSTGFDFPDDECRYQIIGKVPFPDSRSLVLQARQERDKDFFAYVAAQNIVQMAGRGMRSSDDWCETIIVDDNWQWFYSKYRRFMPRWFTVACTKSSSVAPPPLSL